MERHWLSTLRVCPLHAPALYRRIRLVGMRGLLEPALVPAKMGREVAIPPHNRQRDVAHCYLSCYMGPAVARRQAGRLLLRERSSRHCSVFTLLQGRPHHALDAMLVLRRGIPRIHAPLHSPAWVVKYGGRRTLP